MRGPVRIARVAAPLRRQVEQQIRRTILEGRFPSGTRLTERELCELLAVSRTSVREALRLLEAEGLIVILPNQGPVVASISIDEARQIYEVHVALEALAGRGFVRCGTEAQLADLSRCIEDLERIANGEPGNVLAVQTHFHEVLFAGCGNKIASQMLTPLRNRQALLRENSSSKPGWLPQCINKIKRVVTALKARNEDAVGAACVDHVEWAAAASLRVLAERGGHSQQKKEKQDEQRAVGVRSGAARSRAIGSRRPPGAGGHR